ncbi:GNAT family N-acetyltransferase [Kaistella flava (ex Peng et al. 2021)]|uniref:GNAT family N-acetyltransferase n=1 Tax=Kaistella flava (ex Peng et al. 2021) TaxID=2038776 RepID=A0A7M2Y8B4_9FLAO|nr:GNAT family N-acetyltransferase [Kaistella flava (ex Peng et al. 2021)]QOW10340.1 GNAT family N-acetyltransferase [Kaistella flava (ex Peng et al. 2021)]
MEINIRKIQQSDNKLLATIIRSCFHDFNVATQGTVYDDPTTDHLSELFKEENSALFVAEVDGELCGCCGIFPTEGLPERCGELVKFYIAKDFRGKGLGKKLMEESIEFAKKSGYQSIYIESLPEFSTAVSIYEKQGFTYLEKPLGNSGHSGCNLWMIKHL